MAKSKRGKQRRSPVSTLDSVDRHVSDATATDDALKRYQLLMRSTVVWLGGFALAALFIVMGGFAVVVYLAGLSLPAVIGIGVGVAGTATTLVTAMVKTRSSFLAAAKQLSPPDAERRSDNARTGRRE
ncbi:hypothetical protein [Kribbella sp. NPDC003557]|uniref:hypothetical protein n=1 Tax=Kribbella sp. NPDC003557 TaxID=3154449 RepID=UPI0033AAAEB8